jgi:ElaB/YqjD/DUF883 family membrane-anchored ribosome-binding protein
MDQSNDRSLSAVGDFATEPPTDDSTLESMKSTVADKLHNVADIIDKKVEQNRGSAVAGYAKNASDWLDNAAEYVRDADPRKVKADIQRQVRNNPGRSLMVAAGAGLVLGFLFRRR